MSTCPQILRTVTEFAACVPPEVAAIFWPRASVQRGQAWVLQTQQALRGGYSTLESAYVFQLVPQTGTAGQYTTGGYQGAQLEEARPNSLAQANFWYAAELCSEIPPDLLTRLCEAGGVRQDIAEVERRAGAAVTLAAVATEAGILIPDAIAQAAVSGAAGVWDKFTSGLQKLFQNPGEWAQRVFITEPGKAIQWAGRQLIEVTTASQLGRWLLDPLGFIQWAGSFLEQLGNAMVAGNINAFDERAFALATADHWRRMGAALAIVSPFLPPPFNIAGLALAAIFTAAGLALQNLYAQAEALRQAEKNERDAAAAAAAAAERAATLSTYAELSDSANAAGLPVDSKIAAFLGLAALGVILAAPKLKRQIRKG